MSSKVGDIAIGVLVDVEPLKRGLQGATRNLNQFSSQARQHGATFAKTFSIMAAAAVGATVAIVNSQRKTIDALAETSDALGIATEKLQALNHFAQLNGSSAEQMEKGLRKMEKALGEAARKGGATAEALKHAGLSISGIINLSPDQQLQQIANALGNIENQSIKASIASDLFGRDGISMLVTLNQLRKEGIEPTVQELEQLGISISRVDAAKVEAANDAIYKAQQVIGGVGKTITVELAPYIEEVANQFIEAARASGGFGNEIKAAIDTGIRSTAKFADVLHGLRVVFKGVELVAVGFGAAVITAFQVITEALVRSSDGWRIIVNKVIDGLNLLGADIAKIDPFKDSPFMTTLREQAEGARNKVVELNSEFQALLMGPLPSKQVEAFLETVKQKSAEAAKSVAAVSSGNVANGDAGTFGDDERVKTGSINVANDEFGFGPTEDPFDPEAIAAKNEVLLQQERDFWTNKGQITEHGLTSIASLVESSQGKQAGVYANSFASILSSTATYSKKAFEINKKFALGEAIVKGYQSATAAWSAGMATGGPQAPFVAAAYLAASLAKTGAQIKAIKSQSFGGGGSGSAGGGTGGASGALPGASVPQQSAQPVSTIVNMTIQGDSISRRQFGSITKQLNDEYKAGYRLNVG